MENSYRVVWEMDIDAESPEAAAQQAYDSIVKKISPVFEIHQWQEPEMIRTEPVAMIDIREPNADLPKPDRRDIHESYMGPGIV